SDPSADGPTIQRAMERALAGDLKRGALTGALESVRAARRETDVPIVLFGYYNPLIQRGLPRVADEARAAGVDGLLVVDLPPEEAGRWMLSSRASASRACRCWPPPPRPSARAASPPGAAASPTMSRSPGSPVPATWTSRTWPRGRARCAP